MGKLKNIKNSKIKILGLHLDYIILYDLKYINYKVGLG